MKSEMPVISHAHFRPVFTDVCLYLLLLLPAALEVLVYEVPFFVFCLFLFQYDLWMSLVCVRIEYSASKTQKHSLS